MIIEASRKIRAKRAHLLVLMSYTTPEEPSRGVDKGVPTL